MKSDNKRFWKSQNLVAENCEVTYSASISFPELCGMTLGIWETLMEEKDEVVMLNTWSIENV